MAPPFSWHRLVASERPPETTVAPRQRLRICGVVIVVLLGLVFLRLVHLEVTQGAAFRQEAVRPLLRRVNVPGTRGRIVARDGTVLACDQETLGLAVHYRYLEEPPNPQWLRSQARTRLSRAERRNPERVAAEMARLRVERAEQVRQLAGLCGLSVEEWRRRAAGVQSRVEQIAERVNRRREDRAATAAAPTPASPSWSAWLSGMLEASMHETPSERITVAEELASHPIVRDLPAEAVAEFQLHPEAYPGVQVVPLRRRLYPCGSLAAQVVGHLGPLEPDELELSSDYLPDDRLGRLGLERRYETLLRGSRGTNLQRRDRAGRLLGSDVEQPASTGRDLHLTLDPTLQRTAEELLDDALRRRAVLAPGAPASGGAAVVLDAQTGAVLAAASAPRFDPNLFGGERPELAEAVLGNAGHPMLNRVTAMALPPGSVFKIVTAIALLEARAVTPETPFACRGYLDDPSQWRCAIFRRQGIGHGDLTLADALARSCNVYFLHHAAQMGPEPLVAWATRLGMGSPTGIDLPGESAGLLPTPESVERRENRAWGRDETLALAIGQGSLQVTPLQVARLLAAVANGGRLVTPHIVQSEEVPSLAIAELHRSTLQAVQEGLRRVVADPQGTAHATVALATVDVAGKTGTAETDREGAEHAWFAGYAPAEQPKVVLVVALEHAGNADEAAGPVAKRIVVRLEQLGYF